MWIPFGLPGQILLEGSEAGSIGDVASRPAIALNGERAYDPLVGGFLSPDRADTRSRLLPEGYLYGRGDYVGLVDPRGGNPETLRDLKSKIVDPTWELDIDVDCYGAQAFDDPKNPKVIGPMLEAAAAKIAEDIDKCKAGECGKRGGPDIKRQWKFALLTGKFKCATKQKPVVSQYTYKIGDNWRILDSRDRESSFARTEYEGTLGDHTTIFAQVANGGCWTREVAHETLHKVLQTIPVGYALPDRFKKKGALLYGDSSGMTWSKQLDAENLDDHSVMLGAKGLLSCIRCN